LRAIGSRTYGFHLIVGHLVVVVLLCSTSAGRGAVSRRAALPVSLSSSFLDSIVVSWARDFLVSVGDAVLRTPVGVDVCGFECVLCGKNQLPVLLSRNEPTRPQSKATWPRTFPFLDYAASYCSWCAKSGNTVKCCSCVAPPSPVRARPQSSLRAWLFTGPAQAGHPASALLPPPCTPAPPPLLAYVFVR
jgi:hypothetical protein